MRAPMLHSAEAVDLVRGGAIIAYPTEAVYGLGCDPGNETAVGRLLALKDRPVSSGLILIGSDFTQFSGWVGQVPAQRLEQALASWPGPVTWLFPKGPKAPAWITGSHDSLAIRVTAHEISSRLCARYGGPLVSTSANPGGRPPARSAAEVDDYFGDSIAGIVEGGLGENANPSRIQDVMTGRVLREG